MFGFSTADTILGVHSTCASHVVSLLALISGYLSLFLPRSNTYNRFEDNLENIATIVT